MTTNPDTKQILVIDNDKDSRTLLSVILKEKQNHFLFLNSDKEIIKVIRLPIDLIFIELHSICNNYEFISRIKSLKPQTPLIALTACVMNNERSLSLEYGCDAYISKPINSKKLKCISRKYLLNKPLTQSSHEKLEKN